MRYKFFAKLEASIQVDDPTFDRLELCMKAHYDVTVRLLTEQGGFMYGSRNRRSWGGDDLEYRNVLELDSRRLQLCMKALELRAHVVGNELDAFNNNLHKLWHAMVEASRLLNEEVLAAGGDV